MDKSNVEDFTLKYIENFKKEEIEIAKDKVYTDYLSHYLRDVVKKLETDQNLNEDELEMFLSKAEEFLSSIYYALTKESKESLNTKTSRNNLWNHIHTFPAFHDTRTNDKLFTDVGSLANCFVEYVDNPELQNDFLDWVFLDAFIFSECLAHLQTLQTKYLSIWTSFFSPDIVFLAEAIQQIIGFVLRFIILPLIITTGWFYNYQILAVAFCPALIAYYFSFFINLKKRKDDFNLHSSLLKVYHLLNSSTINPEILWNAITNLHKQGGIFSNAVYCIVNKMLDEKKGILRVKY